MQAEVYKPRKPWYAKIMMQTKDYVLYRLKTTEGYCSGETLSAEAGISRAAVNSAVSALRREGYEIASSTNKGYKLTAVPDKISLGELAAYTSADYAERVVCLSEISSTNAYLKELAAEGAAAGTAVIAEKQEKGRGRMGRSFFSPKGGLYMSYLLLPIMPLNEVATVTARTAVAVRRAIKRSCGVNADIKWVNDLQCGGKKLCGILSEMSVESESCRIQYIVIGLGIDVNGKTSDFPTELQDKVTTLQELCGHPVNRNMLAAYVIEELSSILVQKTCDDQGIFAEYRDNCVTLNKKVGFSKGGAEYSGVSVGLTENYGLKVVLDDGTAAVVDSGEVSLF